MRRPPPGVQSVLEPAIAALGYELVGMEYLRQGGRGLLRIFIDSEQGITLDDCGRVSHQASGILDVEDPIREQYVLEVSSPGLDRPLFTAEHFRRFAGSAVKIRLASPVGGQRNFKGVLQGVVDGEVVIAADEREVRLPLEKIEKANLVPEL